MNEPWERVSVRRIAERATNRTQKALEFGEIAPNVSSGEFLTLNSRHDVGCADLP